MKRSRPTPLPPSATSHPCNRGQFSHGAVRLVDRNVLRPFVLVRECQ